jgi:membrane carboxypeptidase/penicillin-binding protein PbpC
MEEKYNEEVRNSDIYVGIFGTTYSEPTINEYRTAQESGIPVLVFIKNTHHDTKLEVFLNDIKNPRTGIVASHYNNVTDLRIRVRDSISNCVSRNFQKKMENTDYEQISSELGKKVYEKKGYTKVPLATGKILEFETPSSVSAGTENKVFSKVKGNGKYMFLTLAIIDPEKNQNWFADNNTVDLIKNEGQMELQNREYSNSWKFVIFGSSKPGTYTAFLGLYEDTKGLPTLNRRLIDYDMKQFTVS